jgi:hypothetical protein
MRSSLDDGLQLLVPGFKHTLTQYMDHMTALGMRLLHLLAMGLGLPESWFDDKFDRPMLFLRPLHYDSTLSNPTQVLNPTHPTTLLRYFLWYEGHVSLTCLPPQHCPPQVILSVSMVKPRRCVHFSVPATLATMSHTLNNSHPWHAGRGFVLCIYCVVYSTVLCNPLCYVIHFVV